MKTKGILAIFVLGILLVSAFACEAGIPTKRPEDVIPLAVPGFSFVEKSDHVTPIFEGEEYSAYSFFAPKANSNFENKVEFLHVSVSLFEDDASCQAVFDGFTTSSAITSSSEIQVNGGWAILAYYEDFGEATAFQQRGRLLILSTSWPPSEWPLPDTETFDKQALQNAAIDGLKAIRL